MAHQNVWETNRPLQNSAQILRNQNMGMSRPAPVLPPRPMTSSSTYNSYTMPYSFNSYNSPSPYSSYGYGSSPYGTSYGNPYGGSMYGNYGQNQYSPYDDHERRFIQYAEENSRQTFASVESVVRAFNSLAMMLDNTFFAMTSSFRAVLGVADNFGRLRTMFGHIWYSLNVFRYLTWLYRKFMLLLGVKVAPSATRAAWQEAANGAGAVPAPSGGSSWPTLAFLGVIVSAPYIISKFLPKYEDKLDPATWKTPGIKAKACFDFVATSPNELSIHTNDDIVLAPTYVQEELRLKNTGWAYAVHNGKSGVVPLNYIVINKSAPEGEKVLVSRLKEDGQPKSHQKRVSFGDIEIFENNETLARKEKIPPENTG